MQDCRTGWEVCKPYRHSFSIMGRFGSPPPLTRSTPALSFTVNCSRQRLCQPAVSLTQSSSEGSQKQPRGCDCLPESLQPVCRIQNAALRTSAPYGSDDQACFRLTTQN